MGYNYRNMYKSGKFLSKEEEYELIRRVQENNDQKSMGILIDGSLKCIYSLVSSLGIREGYEEDLMNEAILGFMVGVKRFDMSRECRLWSYANWWVRAYIKAILYGTESIANRTDAHNISRIHKEFDRLSKENENYDRPWKYIEDVSKNLDIPLDIISRVLNTKDFDLDAFIYSEEDNTSMRHLDMLKDYSPSPEDIVSEKELTELYKNKISKTLSSFSNRNKDIFIRRFLSEDPETLKIIGSEYNISRERARQIESWVFNKVKNILSEDCST